MRPRPTTRINVPMAAAAIALAMFGAFAARGERPLLADELPADLDGVGIVEHLGETIPMDIPFVDDHGRAITLRDVFPKDRPTILTMNYYRCQMLCDQTLNALVHGMKGLDWTMGGEYEVVTVSIAPEEGPDLAAVKKRSYIEAYGRDTGAKGWHFLTGEKENIERLAKAVGFGYRKVEKSTDYAHTASIMFVTRDGRLSLYINDLLFEPRDLRLALVEASEGTIGSPMDKFLLFMCYQYDPDANSYAMSAVKLMRFGGILTLIAIVVGIFVLRRTVPRIRPEAVALGGAHS
ncbi:MAG: SCO family protein [Planctomycetes bacterium]|nr:SCO family protein [Planctomycetota bacterium]